MLSFQIFFYFKSVFLKNKHSKKIFHLEIVYRKQTLLPTHTPCFFFLDSFGK